MIWLGLGDRRFSSLTLLESYLDAVQDQGKQMEKQPGWVRVDGVVQPGYGVASGQGESPYPGGTIALQTPRFQALGLDLSRFYPGTLNLSIAPHQFVMQQPEFTFRQVDWTPHHPPEDFSFSPCHVMFQAIQYNGLVYYPHPETKRTHFQRPSLIEVLAPEIAGIQSGDRVSLLLNPQAILILEP